MTKAEYTREWRKKNKEKFKQQEKEYYLNNKQSIIKVKASYEKTRMSKDLNYKLRKRLRSRLAMAIKNGSAIRDLGCSIEELKTYLESKFESGMSWDNWGIGEGKWQIDHIYPLHKVNLEERSQLQKVTHYTNLQPIWHADHIKKSISERE